MHIMQITKQVKEKTYKELKSLLKNNKKYIIMNIRDFNSKIGNNYTEDIREESET